MTDRARQILGSERLQAKLDWAVFALGIFALTMAVSGTVLTKTALLG